MDFYFSNVINLCIKLFVKSHRERFELFIEAIEKDIGFRNRVRKKELGFILGEILFSNFCNFKKNFKNERNYLFQ